MSWSLWSTKTDFARNAAGAVVILVGLLVLERLPALTHYTGPLESLVEKMRNGQLNADDYHALAAGYYEGIERVDRISQGAENEDYRLRDDFLRFEFKPGLHRQIESGLRFTNSFGMANPEEYGYRKPPHTRRIAWLGDSVSLGPYGHSYEMLLEDRLNRDALTSEIQKFQILNFSVRGYILLQEMDVALEKAPKFEPDVYVVALTSQEITGSLRHIARMVIRGTDLKYDFLRRITQQAGVQSTDHLQIIVNKLKPYFIPITRGGLERIRDHARAEGAGMIVALVPAPVSPDVTAADFDNLHSAVDAVGIPVIDLRDTFRNANLREIQVNPDSDIHPNVRGHQMIFESLSTKLRENTNAWTIVTGTDAVAPRQ